jgi:hypothetical protein
VDAELRPRPLLSELFERSRSAGKGQEGIGAVGHEHLPLVHRVDEDQLGQVLVDGFARLQRPRDDARDLRPGGEGGIRHRAHQADVAAAVDQRHAGAADRRADGARRLDVDRVEAREDPQKTVTVNRDMTRR